MLAGTHRSWVRRVSVLAVWFIALFVASAALAQGGEKPEAEALFQAGRDLVSQNRLEEACQKFEASQRLDPALGTMLHLADCYERIGKTASAWAMFQEAASLAQASEQPAREQIARTRTTALEPKLSRIELHVDEQRRVPNLAISVSGAPVPSPSWGIAFPVDPGQQTVRATAPGYEPWTTTVEIARNAHEPLVVDVPALEKAKDVQPEVVAPPPVAPRVAPRPVPSPHSQTRRGSVQRIIGIVTGSVGLAALTAGVALGAEAMVTNSKSLDECRPEDPTRCTPKGVELRGSAENYALGSTVGFALGGGLAAAGLLVVLTAPSESESGHEIVITPVASPQAAALAVRGSW